jgi:hypothetical protein
LISSRGDRTAAFLDKHGFPFESAKQAWQQASEAHNRIEMEVFALVRSSITDERSSQGFQTPGSRHPRSERGVPDTRDPRGFQTPAIPRDPSETRTINAAPRALSFSVGYLTRQLDLILLSITVIVGMIAEQRTCIASPFAS